MCRWSGSYAICASTKSSKAPTRSCESSSRGASLGMADPDILFDVRDGVARVVLNRPDALNALTLDMCLALDARLREWQDDPVIKSVLIRGQGSRAFCAGGDIRRLYDERGSDYPRQFYRAEYRLNARLHRFAKPYIAFLDGIVMGGGVGVSVHG